MTQALEKEEEETEQRKGDDGEEGNAGEGCYGTRTMVHCVLVWQFAVALHSFLAASFASFARTRVCVCVCMCMSWIPIKL